MDIFQLSEERQIPDWMRGDTYEDENTTMVVDKDKLARLVNRRARYCDITQNATEEQLHRLMVKHNNNIPKVIEDLELWVRTKGSQTVVPVSHSNYLRNFYF